MSLAKEAVHGGSHCSLVEPSLEEGPLWSVCWGSGGNRLAAAGTDRVIRIYVYAPDNPLRLETELRNAHEKAIRSLDWRNSLLAAASFDGTVSIWKHIKEDIINSSGGSQESYSWKCVATLEGHENEVKAVKFSPDGSRLATCGRDKTVWIWKIGPSHLGDDEDAELEFECEAVLQEHSQDVKTVLWHPSGDILFSSSYDNSIMVFGCPFGEDDWLCLAKLEAHESTVWALSWHEGALYSASADRSVIKWSNADSGPSKDLFSINLVPDKTLQNVHEEAVYCMDARGDRLVTGGADCCIRITDLHEHNATSVIMPSQVNSIRFHPTDDGLLAAALDSGQLALVRIRN